MNMSLRHFKDAVYLVGINGRNLFSNYIDVFSGPVLKDATFVTLLGQTVLWTAINVFFHVTIGMGLALLLYRKMRGKGIYRTILVIPWAIPQVIACLAWRGEFSFDYGFVNILLRSLGIAPVQWLTEGWSNFAAMCITNIWLGVPFMMVILLGGLQSIAGEYYEAAEMDESEAE